MLHFLPHTIRGILGVIFLVSNLLFWFLMLLPSALIKLIFPFKAVRRPMDKSLNFFCTSWASCNIFLLTLLNDIQWEVKGNDKLSMNDWYLVIANHQTWADIPVLQYALNNRVPYFRYFLKQELMWIPIFNFIWYSLDYPFMKRYSREFIKKNPHLKGKDIETTRKACLKYRDVPVAIMNFSEGTRFDRAKHQRQQSPFKYLLKPKAGGIAFVLSAMGDQLSTILDVTISYTPRDGTFWDFLSGRVTKVQIRIKRIKITDNLMGDYFDDDNYKQFFQNWVNDLWQEKDQLMQELDQH